MPPPEINVGLFIAATPTQDEDALGAFAQRLADDVCPFLDDASGGVPWRLHAEEPVRLESDDARRPSDFLDEASLRMVEGPFDLVVVVTDAALISRRQRVVPGLASPAARLVVVSTRRLVMSPRGEPLRPLNGEAVRWNAATLLVHLLGQVLGVSPAPEGPMAPFRLDPHRSALAPLDAQSRRAFARAAPTVPDREQEVDGVGEVLRFHLASAGRNVGQVLRGVWRSRAPLLPLSLPGLATAAVAPTFILVFTAEIWDVGLHMADTVAWSFAVASVLAAAAFLVSAQNLFFPRKDRRLITEHMAVVNVTVFLTMLLAVIGLFVMVGALMLFVETYVFPPDLISTWPTLEDPDVTLGDKVRLAAFMSTVGVLTGALAGGLESRNLIRHLALFRDAP